MHTQPPLSSHLSHNGVAEDILDLGVGHAMGRALTPIVLTHWSAAVDRRDHLDVNVQVSAFR
jgi:hypothetical protein